MSIVRRMMSGNAAGMVSMVLNIAAQVALVPLFLHYWDAARYGLWLAITTAIALITIVDNAHLDFLGYACLKVPHADRDTRSQLLSDALPAMLVVGVAEFALLAAVLFSPATPMALGVAATAPSVGIARWSLIAMMAVWYLLQLPVGLIGRGLASVGHYPLTAWWYLPGALGQAVFPAIGVWLGADLGGALVIYVVATVVLYLLCAIHYVHVARRERLRLRRPDFGAGLRRFGGGVGLGAAALLEYGQQAGLRLVLLPFFGTRGLVQFSTLRTVANVVQQGLITLVNPAVPELMRYVSARDDLRTRAVAIAVLYVTVVAMCPGFVLMQTVVPPLFELWTHGKVAYDGPAFAALSATVLLFGLSQTGRAIVRGNNLVAAQTAISAICGLVLLATVFAAAGRFGVRGAALGVVAAELVRFALTYAAASRWLRGNGFGSLRRVTGIAGGAIATTIAFLAVIALSPEMRIMLSLLYVPIWLAMNLIFWRAIPAEVRAVVMELAGDFRVIASLRDRYDRRRLRRVTERA